MGIVDVECPECGGAASIGVPNDQAVHDVAPTESALSGGDGKERVVACARGHEVHVRFGP